MTAHVECRSVSPSAVAEVEEEENETTAAMIAPVVDDDDADSVASFPKFTDTSISSVDLTATDRVSEQPWSRPNEILAQLKQFSNVVVHMIASAEQQLQQHRDKEAEEKVDEDLHNPLYSAPLQEPDKTKLKWYERPFKTHPFEYIPKPIPSRFNCLCPGIVDF